MEKAAKIGKNQIVEILARSKHGELSHYKAPVLAAAQSEPEFLAHLIAWNHEHGSIDDSKMALPLISVGPFRDIRYDAGVENSLAHIALLNPRDFLYSLKFAKADKLPNTQRQLKKLAERYLRHREQSFGFWERAVLTHRESMKTLYAFPWAGGRVKPGKDIYKKSLFDNDPPTGSALWIVKKLPTMEPLEALGHIIARKLPFHAVRGHLMRKLSNPDVMLGLIQTMSPTELAANAVVLKRFGIDNNPMLRAAFSEALAKASAAPSKRALHKTAKAAAKVGGAMGERLQRVQEKQISAAGDVKGRWGIFGDRSQSMTKAIELARFVAGHVARRAEEAHLVFFNGEPYYKNVTGWTLEQIQAETAMVRADGGTSPGVALDYLLQRGIEVDGIAITTDGGERHHPAFVDIWQKYCKRFDKEPTLYIFEVDGGDPNWLSQRLNAAGITHELFNLRGSDIDYYAIENMIKTMGTRRYGLVDKIMEAPLKTLDEIFTTKGEDREGQQHVTATA